VTVSSAGSAIRTEGLTKVYRAARAIVAVDSLDLEVRPGEVFGLLGPNGAGKTTTVGMLTTRVVPTAGGAWVAGIDVIAHPSQARRFVGVVPQTNTLDRSLDVRENLEFHGRYFGMGPRQAKREAAALLERFRLSDHAGAEVDALSGGLAQRLMVARAIMHSPSVLFLDEPTAGLDPQSRIALWELVGELHGRGQTILLTTHYMEEADQLCERVAIMDHGRILALDTPAALKQTIGATREFRVSATDRLEALATHMRTLAGVSDVHVVDSSVHVFAAADGPSLPALISHADRAGFAISDASVHEPTLESVFITLTGKELRE
jgi:ABC-2 type transport system ATP-binding protein